MKVEQIYTGCLAQGAYYIESQGEAVIIDPLREVQPYLKRANKDGAKIKYIFETHFHADFVSGHVDLSQQTSAAIVYGPNANPVFEAHIAKDGEVFQVGNVSLTVLHTPGHTMESTTYLLKDEEGKDHAIFTGDTLFLGDVGRPDLAQKAADMTQEDLAGMLFDSLRSKIMPLGDEVTVYPAHGAGSACGKKMMNATLDSLGNQKRMNYALRADMTKAEFIKEVTDGLLPPPKYFPENVRLNKEGYQSLDKVLAQGLKALPPVAFETAAQEIEGAIVLDTRDKVVFAEAHIPRAISIGLTGTFAPWVGALISDVTTPIFLVTDEGKAQEAVTRLARVGFDNTLGYLEGGMAAWQLAGKETDSIKQVNARELATGQGYAAGKPVVIDVRREEEFNTEHIAGAINIPLNFINEQMANFPQEQPFLIHCRSGYRSVIAASILKARGYHDLADVIGGILAVAKTDVAMQTGASCSA